MRIIATMKHTQILSFILGGLFALNTLWAQPQDRWSATTAAEGEVYGAGVISDKKGNIYTIGTFNGVAIFDTIRAQSKGETDFFIQKLNPNGDVQWVKTFGGIGNDEVFAISLDIFENIFISGSFENSVYIDKVKLTSKGDADAFIIKFNPYGKVLWAKGIGGSSYDSGAGITIDRNNSLYLTGEYADSIDFDPGPGKAAFFAPQTAGFVLKLDADGGFVWAKSLGSGLAVGADPQSRIVVAGGTHGGQSDPVFTQYAEPAAPITYTPSPAPPPSSQPTAPVRPTPAPPTRPVVTTTTSPSATSPAPTQPSTAPTSTPQPPAPPQLLTAPPLNNEEMSRALTVVENAKTYLGAPYLRAGTTREGIDCSGLCMVAYQTIGITLPHKSTIIAALVSVKVSPLPDLAPGDIVCFNNSAPDGRVDHVGVVSRVENGKVYFIHATVSAGVVENELSKSEHWLPKYRYCVRPVREGSLASRLARLPYFEIGD